MKTDSAAQHWTDQPRAKRGEEAHRFQGGFAQVAQAHRLAISMKQPLTVEQRLFNLGIIWKNSPVRDSKPQRRLAFSRAKVLNAFFCHQSSALLGQQNCDTVSISAAAASHG
jgi:hypothetical protein